MFMQPNLPLPVSQRQPVSVGPSGYRIWMASELKRVLRQNVRALIEKTSGPLKPHESGVTRLLKLGISNGNAQRLLDEDSTVSFQTVEQAAAAFKVKPWDLMSPQMQIAEMPFRDLDVFEGQLVTLFRKLDADDRHEHLIDLNNKVSQKDVAASPHNPFNRRFHSIGHDPERRSATRIDERVPAPVPDRKRGNE